jgi:serine/threonine protein kinase
MTKFRQEGAIKLDHQHIARIYDTGQVEGRPYIVMEYVDGITLRKLIDSRPISIETALIIVGQMLLALEYAHRNQVIHRDIKPENVMLSTQHGVKIIDFGIAKVLSTVTRTRDGMVIGTPQYMSYEQAMGQAVTPASDIYATAIVLYELLTANVPFTSENSIEVVQMHQTARPAPPRKLNPAIPEPVEAAILRSLEKDQQLRFRSAIEFATALGCPLGKPLPPDVIGDVSRMALPVANERSNAVDLPTRAPAPPSAVHGGWAVLRVESGSRQGQIILLSADQVIGRMEIDPSDGTISRQHFRLERQRGSYMISDSSTYGTVVNGVRLRGSGPQPIQPGTQIQVGQTILIYENHS